MVSIGLYLVSVLRGLAEIAGMCLLAQGALVLLGAGQHQRNFVYQLFCVVTRPVLWATRRALPKAVGDRHLAWVAGSVLFALWIVLAYARQLVCAVNACG